MINKLETNGIDIGIICNIALLTMLDPDKCIMIIAPTLSEVSVIRNQFTKSFDYFNNLYQQCLTPKCQNRSEVSFTNDSHIFFRTAQISTGCGLTTDLLIIINPDKIKNFKELEMALYPCLYPNGDLIICR